MHTLTNWKAKRAGGRITVYGDGPNGEAIKLVGVDEIRVDPNDGRPMVFAIIDHVNPPQVYHLKV